MQEGNENVESAGLEGVSLHDHLCLLYQGEAEILNPVVPFIQKGVALGERCVYLNGGEETLERVLKNALLGQKHDTGALVLLPLQESWLKGGEFDPARVLHQLQTICAGAAGDGFKGTRIICDMGWAGKDPRRLELLHEFELALHRFSTHNDVALLCLYRRETFPAERMLDLAKLHPQLVIGGNICSNPFYLPSDRNLHVTRANSELDLFLGAVQQAAVTSAECDRLREELEQAYAALARKIYENWQEEDTLRGCEKELHEKDEALLAHKRRLQTILQHIPAILMAFDGNANLAACNHEFERVSGFRVEEVMGKPMLELFQVEGAQAEEVVDAHPSHGGDYRGREWSLRCKDGTLKTVSWSNMSRYVPIPGWTNWITGVDLTPRVSAAKKGDELGELEVFGYAVSHDLSGQLSKISGHCAVMQDLYGMALTPQCLEMLKSIQDATIEMVGRISALQRFAALTSEGIEPEEVNLSVMASEIAAELNDSGAARPVTFRIEDGVTATGDRRLLRLAMEQLLENAWNYTLGVSHPVIQFGTTQVEGERSYFVSDNGPRPSGEPGAHLPGRKLENPDRICCGIGLATVQRIISLHRGKIWVDQNTGKGGILYFTV